MPRLSLRYFILFPLLLGASPAWAEEEVPSYLNEIMPILTRQGCNQGSCHGKGAGQNGFRLSLRGYAPDTDHRWITREFAARRIVPTVPEDSLMLRKPTGSSPHEGGRIFDSASREYQTILNWIKAGAPGPKKDDAKLLSLELEPKGRLAKVGEEFQIKAVGEFSDGSKRDVTWLTRFDSNDAGLVSVTPGGFVKALRNGETAIRASFQTEVGVTIVTVPYTHEIAFERFKPRNNFIDDAAYRKLAQLRIEPAELSNDEEFIRRAFIDTIGTLPTATEVREFLASEESTKRAKLIDQLLERSEFVDYWALQLSDLLQNRKERDHDVRGTKGVRSFHEWLRKQVAVNRPWDELAREVLTSRGLASANPAIGYYIVTVGEQREVEKSEVVGSVAQAFLGTRIGCSQCHNHPLERYTQDDYYHFAGFFSRIKMDRKESKMGGVTALALTDLDPKKKNEVGVRQPRTGQFLAPRPLDRSDVEFNTNEDPRVKLAAWMTDPKNEAFSGAMVNRVWKHFLGTGLVEPVDDLRATNPPSNPELWKALNREFVEHKYDLKHLMRQILNSRIYQLTSTTAPGNETDTRFYSHYYARRLPAEVLLDAISECTGIPDTFPGYPLGLRAIQLPDPTLKSYFLTLFGRSERVTACACERMGDVTMPQLLHLQNGESIVQRNRDAESRLSKWLKVQKDDQILMEEMFLTAFARRPSEAEKATVNKLLAAGEPRDEVFRDLYWALLNSKNFAFNH
ncbi:MAG: DUF1549 and DUF1553 domain-containing protein [Planctomycetes bacterium]|nr:DUF1549 and DUF1553 domain-containing protein [Planctomycetota bacterium]